MQRGEVGEDDRRDSGLEHHHGVGAPGHARGAGEHLRANGRDVIVDAKREAHRGARHQRRVDQPRRRPRGTGRRGRAAEIEQHRRAVAVDADGVEMKAGENAIALRGLQSLDPRLAAEQAGLLAVEEENAQRAAQRRPQDLLDDAERHRAAGGVVGRARTARHRVVVGREDDLAQAGVGAAHQPFDVARAVRRHLDAHLLGAEAPQPLRQQIARVVVRGRRRQPRPEVGQLVDQGHRRLRPARRAPRPSAANR